jgi:hypothetical protein
LANDGLVPTTTITTSRSTRWLQAVRPALARHAYAAVALPLGLIALVVAPLGGARRVDRWQRALASRLLGMPADVPASHRRGPTRRVLTHAVLSLPANLVGFALVVPAWAVFLGRGVFYPAFGADHLEQSWGGPTLAGAWFAHFILGPPMLLVVTLLLGPVSRFQSRLALRYFATAG